MNTPLISFGILSDVQYANCKDGFNWSGDKIRYYRSNLDLVSER